jgi:hypothetical protein
MRPNEFREFVAVMGAAAETLNQPKLTPLGLRTAFAILQGYPLESVKAAVQQHLRESPFMPKPADIVKYIEGTVEDRANIMWGHVVKAIRKYGHYESIRFDDPAIHYAIDRMGGWQKLCGILEEELPFREKDFIAHYRRGMKATWEDVPKRFIGEIELRNLQGSWDKMIPETVEIKTRHDQKFLIDKGDK